MAGTIPYSLSQQFDEFGKPLAGGRLYLIQAGTVSTPQNGYQDSALTLVLPNPIILDDAGRLPQFFLADGSIKIRLTKSNGVDVVTADGILVVGASSGGGGGSPVDATTVLATGDIKTRYSNGVLAGFVRLNGRTLGSSTSGATERANADTQALFEYLWNNDANLAVSGGRGVSSIADWSANKTLTLPDARGRIMAGLDDMGSTLAGILTGATISAPTTLGAKGGTESKAITQGNLPSYTLPKTLATSSSLAVANTLGLNDPGHFHTPDPAGHPGIQFYTFVGSGAGNNAPAGANSTLTPNTSTNTTGVTLTGGVSLTGSVSITGDTQSGGSGTAISALPPVMLITIYIKL